MIMHAWAKPQFGLWNTAASWADGVMPVVSPSYGRLPHSEDGAQFETGSATTYTVSGSALSASLSVMGDHVTFDNFHFSNGGAPSALTIGRFAQVTLMPTSSFSLDGYAGFSTLTLDQGWLADKGSIYGANITLERASTLYVGWGGQINGATIQVAPASHLVGWDDGTIMGTITNNGIIEAASGKLAITGEIIDGGTAAGHFLQVDSGATLELAGKGTSETINMLSGATLQIDKGTAALGLLYGFGPGDVIDLAGFDVKTFTLVGEQTGTSTLTGTDAAGSAEVLRFDGALSPDLIYSHADGHGGTSVVMQTTPHPLDAIKIDEQTAMSSGDKANFTVADQTTGQQTFAAGDKYTGPIQGIDQQFILITPDNLNITSAIPNVFIHTGAGTDAIDVSRANGNNILDGSTGSNFLTGGTGNDTFFLDDRNPTSDVFSTIVNFHSGDNATIFGVNPTDFKVNMLDNQGAANAKGLDFAFAAAGKANANLVIAGFTTADLTNGRLTATYGTTADLPGLPGSQYLNIHAA